jgi:1-acyl-sn-glycerol-3-phosphate acyltransferase
MGWRIQGEMPQLKKFLIILAPHTHWMDFFVALFARTILQVPSKYAAKASLFKPPFGFIFRALGGTPVNRTKSTNMVQAIIDIYNQKDEFILSMAPEGTRKKVDDWKTGFYHIANGAGIPIVRCVFDFENKVFKVLPPFYPTGTIEHDLPLIKKGYEGIKGKIPEYS